MQAQLNAFLKAHDDVLLKRRANGALGVSGMDEVQNDRGRHGGSKLAHSNEIPDTFVLHSPQGIAGGGYTGEKEIVTVSDIVAAMGPRQPSAAEAQTEFNVGFVYLLEPGKTAVAELLALYQAYRDNVVEHWAHTTGGRSEITTVVSAPCASSACVETQSERVDGRDSGSVAVPSISLRASIRLP